MADAQPARHLRVVDADKPQPVAWFYRDDKGELHEGDTEVQKLRDKLATAESDRAKWSSKFHELKRDKEAEALDNPLWPVAVRVFQAWTKATAEVRREAGEKRAATLREDADFNAERFFLVERFLKSKKYGPEYCLRAVAGIAYDHFPTRRRNGSVKRYDEWERVFKNAKEIEERFAAAPRDWREREPFALALDQVKLLGA
jgi:hypothetical protein